MSRISNTVLGQGRQSSSHDMCPVPHLFHDKCLHLYWLCLVYYKAQKKAREIYHTHRRLPPSKKQSKIDMLLFSISQIRYSNLQNLSYTVYTLINTPDKITKYIDSNITFVLIKFQNQISMIKNQLRSNEQLWNLSTIYELINTLTTLQNILQQL